MAHLMHTVGSRSLRNIDRTCLTATIAFIGFVLYVSLYIPSNMDEFIHYHRLACWAYPESVAHIFREGCNAYPAKLFKFEFNRTYSYSGVVSSLIFAPFFYALAEPISHYIYGALCLIIFALLLAKAFNFELKTTLVPLLYFPLLFQILHDTGPIRIALLSYAILIFTVYKIFSRTTSPFVKICLIMISSFFSLLAIDDKPFFLYLVPSIFLIALGNAIYRSTASSTIQFYKLEFKLPNVSKSSCFLFAVLLFFIFSIFVVYLGLTRVWEVGSKDTFPYIIHLMHQSAPSYTFLQELNLIGTYLFSPVVFTSRIYQLTTGELAISAAFFVPVLYFIFSYVKKYRSSLFYFLIISLVILVAIFCYGRKTWTGHHFIFLHIPIIIALMHYANKNATALKGILISLSVVCIASLFQLHFSQEATHSDRNRNDIFKYLQSESIDMNSIINISSWGAYYTQSLFGDKSQVVTFIDPLNRPDAEELIKIQQRLSRKFILNVCDSCTAAQVAEVFNGKKITRVGPSSSTWLIWQISDH